MMIHPALTAGRVAVITGAASGIGFAAAKYFAHAGMRVVLADLPNAALDQAADDVGALAASPDDVLAVPTDVSRLEDMQALWHVSLEAFGEVAVLMNNAGTAPGGGPFDHIDRWRHVLEVNLWGVINGIQVFTPGMIAQGTSCAIISTGSKQGITCPPGDAAYNVSKAGVKVLTEALAHELRTTGGGRISAHLLIPGSTFTGMTQGHTEKPPGAWMPEQVIDRLVEGMGRGDFYILCPDNDVTSAVDHKRILWAAGDIVHNRPPLSRWHPDHAADFAAFLADPSATP